MIRVPLLPSIGLAVGLGWAVFCCQMWVLAGQTSYFLIASDISRNRSHAQPGTRGRGERNLQAQWHIRLQQNIEKLWEDLTHLQEETMRWRKDRKKPAVIRSHLWDKDIRRGSLLDMVNTVHSIMKAVHCTLNTVHCTLYTGHWTLDTVIYINTIHG